MPAAGTSLPNWKTWQKSSCGWQPQDRCNIPCRAEKGSSTSSQAGDDNCSPAIPLLLLIGWVPGDVGFSSHHWSASLHSQGSDHGPAPVPAQPLPSSQCTFSTGAALHQPLLYYKSLKACRSPVWISGESGSLILGVLVSIWSVGSPSANSSSYKGFRLDLCIHQPCVWENGQ